MAFSLNDYEMLEEIGHGGFGAVYRARQKSLGKIVAIKRLSPLKQQNSEQILRFRSEAETMAALTHDNIVSVLDYAFFSGSYYIVMEYIEGATFANVLDRGIARAPALYVLEKIATALEVAHDRGIIHHDVKPENVLLGCSGQVKLADFGLSRLSGGDQFTAAATVQGTMCYLAPEALVSPREADARVDIFSIGCILYCLLTKKLPFEGQSVGEISHRILNEQPETINDSSPLSALAMRCLEKERDKRPSIDEVQCSLREAIRGNYHESSTQLIDFLSGEKGEAPLHALPQHKPGVPDKKNPTRWKTGVIAIIVLSAVIIASIVFFQYRYNRHTLPRLPQTIAPTVTEAPFHHPILKSKNGGAPDAPVPIARSGLRRKIDTIFIKGLIPGDTVLFDNRTISTHGAVRETVITTPRQHHIELRRDGRLFFARQLELIPYERLTIDVRNERKRYVGDSMDQQ